MTGDKPTTFFGAETTFYIGLKQIPQLGYNGEHKSENQGLYKAFGVIMDTHGAPKNHRDNNST